MKMNTAPDCCTTGLKFRLISQGGMVEMGMYPVLFGKRLRAGFVGEPVCEVDWCCGDSETHFWSAYIALGLLLHRRIEDHGCFEGIPRASEIKPYYRDESFLNNLTQLMMEAPNVSLKN